MILDLERLQLTDSPFRRSCGSCFPIRVDILG